MTRKVDEMRIAILDLTTHSEPMLSGLPKVGIQIEKWLSPALPEATFSSTVPALGTFDGVVVSGSEFGVYDQTPWMQPLRAFLLAVKAAGKPIFGICFGHQLMADTFGGKAEKTDSGFAVGVRAFDIEGEAGDDQLLSGWRTCLRFSCLFRAVPSRIQRTANARAV